MNTSTRLDARGYTRKLRRYLNRYLLSVLDLMFAPAEDRPLRHPPVFILGAPRSGSTVIMQVLTDAFDFGYISNAHCRWFGCPAMAERRLINPPRVTQSNYQSTHGITRGDHEPSECGDWWYRFFRRRPSYIKGDELDHRKMAGFRRSLASLTNAFDKPVIFKNLYASFRINAIAKCIPEAVFIVIHRNQIDNGHSLLQTRHRYFEDYGHWWSMEPPNIEKLKALPAHAQVIEQIRETHRIIDRDLRANHIAEDRRFDIEYENFCNNTSEVLDRFERFLSGCGCVVDRKAFDAPELSIRTSIEIDESIYSKMVLYAKGH